MSLNEIDPANSLKTRVDSFTGLPGSISDINRDLFRPLSNAPNSALGGIPMNPLLESDDRTLSASQTKARSGASSVYGNESEIFPIDRTAQQVGKALMDNAITAPVPIGDRVDRAGGYDELLNPNPSNLAASVVSGDTQKELGTGSDWSSLQKADGNDFTEREAYKLPSQKNVFPDKQVYVVVEKDTLSKIAQDQFGDANRWRELLQKTADGKGFKGFTEQEAEQLQIGTKVYIPGYYSFDDDNNLLFDTRPPNAQGIQNIKNGKAGAATEKAWKKYYEECRKDDIDKVFTERFWIEPTTKEDMKFGKLTWENSVTGKKEQYIKDTPVGRRLDLVTISKDGTVTGIEVKATEQEARRKRSREQEARDNNALDRNGRIRDPNPKDDEKLYHTPTSVVRFVGNPPDCDDPEHREKYDKQRRPVAVKNVRVDTDPNSQNNPVESEEDPGVEVEPPNINSPPKPQDYRLPVESEEDPEVDVERRKPKPRNINPPPPRFNVPARPPAIESPKPIDDAPARPPARPPIDDAPARPPVRPPVSTSLLNGVSKLARPLGLVTDVIDLNNAYNEDGGFGENFQETAGSVAGGWGGAAAGAAAGAALGSVVPGLGTVAGGIAGGIIGGFGGSAAGEGIVKGVRDFFG